MPLTQATLPDIRDGNLLPMQFRCAATLRDIGTKGIYWACPIAFSIFFAGSLYAPLVEPESTQLFVVSALLFGCLAVASILYPVLRVREMNRAFVASVAFKRRQLCGIYIPYSNTVSMIFKIMTPVTGLGALGLTLTASDSEARVKGIIGTAVYAGFVAIYAWKGLGRRHGIVIAPDGILFAGMIEGYFVPWETFSRAATFMVQEKYTSSKGIGLQVIDPKLVQTSGSSTSKLVENNGRHGFAVFAHAANILAPTEWIKAVINHCALNPTDRGLLGTDRACEIAAEVL